MFVREGGVRDVHHVLEAKRRVVRHLSCNLGVGVESLGPGVRGFEFQTSGMGLENRGSGFGARVVNLGLGAWGLGVWSLGLGLGAWGLRLGALSLGSGVWGGLSRQQRSLRLRFCFPRGSPHSWPRSSSSLLSSLELHDTTIYEP